TIHLAIGTRNPFILSILFAFVYYFMREQAEKGKWIGFKEKLAIFVGSPILMLAMGVLNYVRDNVQVSHTGFWDILLDFIYKQGTSFGVLARGFLFNSSLPYRDFRNFTFGPVLDYFARGSLGAIFGGKAFEHTTNSVELAIDSNSYAHNLSYLVLNKEYLKGHGIGSSYIMELYTDYGMIGVFLLSFLLGVLFIAMLQVAYRSRTILFALSLLILNNLFFMPRSSFSESFFNLFTMQFWGIVLVIIFVAKMLTKEN
ncbi:O-antigen polysaccharide polymerase Wzy family protein, partial [Streptococcus pneumoniae]